MRERVQFLTFVNVRQNNVREGVHRRIEGATKLREDVQMRSGDVDEKGLDESVIEFGDLRKDRGCLKRRGPRC